MEVSISRKCQFNSAHRLHVASWSEEKNKQVFGLCNNKNYHGHNYTLIVTITGKIDPETGFVIDTKILKEMIEFEIVERFDHKNLNMDCVEFLNLNPTVENMAVVVWKIINNKIDKAFKLKVKLYETERNFAEYEGK